VRLIVADALLQVMTGPIELEDLPKLEKMVSEFDQISEEGPSRILRGRVVRYDLVLAFLHCRG
jgi:hypothetical protein